MHIKSRGSHMANFSEPSAKFKLTQVGFRLQSTSCSIATNSLWDSMTFPECLAKGSRLCVGVWGYRAVFADGGGQRSRALLRQYCVGFLPWLVRAQKRV